MILVIQRLATTPARAAVAVIVVAAIAGAVLLFGQRGDDGDAAPGDETPAAEAYIGPVYHVCDSDTAAANGVASPGDPPVVGQPAPDFALCDRIGAFAMKLSAMKGKVVWLNFWATWCVPCKRELPDIQALYDEFSADGLEVLVINYRESESTALGFLPQLDVSLPSVIDRSGSVYDQYRLTGLPDSFFVARDGTIATVYYGYVNDEIARGRLRIAGIGADAE
jgi:thiol-disulfide isomerase/thioredoxin